MRKAALRVRMWSCLLYTSTFIPESFGAGVGRVRPYFEQGNWFRGGAVQMLFGTWLYDSGLQTKDGRPTLPAGMSREALVAAAKSYDLSAQPPTVDWSRALPVSYTHLDVYKRQDVHAGDTVELDEQQ